MHKLFPLHHHREPALLWKEKSAMDNRLKDKKMYLLQLDKDTNFSSAYSTILSYQSTDHNL